MLNREEIAKQASPITHVRAGIPPIISVHGEADPTVPYSQKQRFHQALDRIGAAHELVTGSERLGSIGEPSFDRAGVSPLYCGGLMT
jgi:predicted esterase